MRPKPLMPTRTVTRGVLPGTGDSRRESADDFGHARRRTFLALATLGVTARYHPTRSARTPPGSMVPWITAARRPRERHVSIRRIDTTGSSGQLIRTGFLRT